MNSDGFLTFFVWILRNLKSGENCDNDKERKLEAITKFSLEFCENP